MRQPLVSIIVPVYNTSSYLPKCFDSLKNQTYRHLEIILIDDGSTDNSGILCNQFAASNSSVVVKHQKNAGLSAARNTGLGLATGDYITFLDSDDFIAPDYVSYLVSLFNDSTAISVCSHYERRENGKLKNFATNYSSAVFSVEEALRRMLNEQGFMVSAWGKLYPRQLFESSPKIRFPVGKLHEDVGTTYRLLLRAYQANPSSLIAFGSTPKYYYNLRRGSITNRGFDHRKMDLIAQTDEMCDAIDAIFPNLKNTTNLRRLHARFSIIRQAKTSCYLNPCIRYIKDHRAWISQNPEAQKRDKLALASLSLGKTAFKTSWQAYELFFK